MGDEIYAWFSFVYAGFCGMYAFFLTVYTNSNSESVVEDKEDEESEVAAVGEGEEDKGTTDVFGVGEVSGTGGDGTLGTFFVRLHGATLRPDV